MRKTFSTFLILFAISILLNAQKQYEPNWESLDNRPTPSWFEDSKFGIFIHWGLYSVPSFTERGQYSEWYWNVMNRDTNKYSSTRVVKNFHNKNFGPNFKYEDFRKDFTCELFDPNQWADVFKRSGAKYVVLTSKHHDGYCLWPNKESSKSFNKPWNSVESGPYRDLVGELQKPVRDAGLKMGYYYSIWDWYNPYWTEKQQLAVQKGIEVVNNNGVKKEIPASKQLVKESEIALDKYIEEVMYPQFKELVNKYEPALIFSDGEWLMSADKWQTKPLLAWLFNNANNLDELVINDRWGQVRGEHGGYYSTEYEKGFTNSARPWEECRGMGMSFGFNRAENIDDYQTTKELVFMFVDIVSRGGNLLLNIGPDSDGTIPVIMQDRLIGMGKWLYVNGEAIYGTRKWVKDAQWSEGNIPTFTNKDFHDGNPIDEMTLNPKPGNAVKDFYFTTKENNLYALSPKWPKTNTIFIKDIKCNVETKVTLLGHDKELPYSFKNNGIEIDISSIGIGDLACSYIYSFKISNINNSK